MCPRSRRLRAYDDAVTDHALRKDRRPGGTPSRNARPRPRVGGDDGSEVCGHERAGPATLEALTPRAPLSGTQPGTRSVVAATSPGLSHDRGARSGGDRPTQVPSALGARAPVDHTHRVMAPPRRRGSAWVGMRGPAARQPGSGRLRRGQPVYHDLASGVRDDRPGGSTDRPASAGTSPTWSTPCRTCRPTAWACGCSPAQGTTTAAGRLVFGVFAALAERELIRRTAPLAGTEAARARGRTSGRKFALSTRRCSELCRELGIRPVTLYREIPLGNGILTIVQKCSNVGHERD